MQRFFLFCIMLILTSEAFPKRFRKNQISEGRKLRIYDLISNQANPSADEKCMTRKLINNQMLSSNDFKFIKKIGKIKIRGKNRKNKYKIQQVKKYKSYLLPFKSKKPAFFNSFYDSFPPSNEKENCFNSVLIHHPQKLKRSTKQSNTLIQFSDLRHKKNHNMGDDYFIKVKSLSGKRNLKDFPWTSRVKSSDVASGSDETEFVTPFKTPYSFSSFINYDLPNHFTIPKVNFKFPYDPKLYEYQSIQSHKDLHSSIKEKSPNKLEENESKNQPRDLSNIRQMLDKVQNVLKDDRFTNSTNQTKSFVEEETSESADFIREKIDKVAIPILAQISEELNRQNKEAEIQSSKLKESKEAKEESKKYQEIKNNKCQPKSDSGCSADGLWLSNSVGAEINITTLPNLMLKVVIKNSKKNGFITKKWYMQGLTLSRHGGPLILAGVCPVRKKVASFIGQCKVCDEEDLIFGMWSLSGCAARCTDVWTAVETKTDILRRKRKGKR